MTKIVTIKVPATSGNLGPGFDVLGLALSLFNDLHVRVVSRKPGAPIIYVKGGNLPVTHPGDSLEVVRRVHKSDDDRALGEQINLGNRWGLDTQHDSGAIQQLIPVGHNLCTGSREDIVRIVSVLSRVVLDPYLMARLRELLDDFRYGRHALFARGQLF